MVGIVVRGTGISALRASNCPCSRIGEPVRYAHGANLPSPHNEFVFLQ